MAEGPEGVMEIFERHRAVMRGHFRLSSGRHSDTYVQCAMVLQHPRVAEELAGMLADRLKGRDAQAVLSPALGGVVIGFMVARALGLRFLFAERKEGRMELRRGQELERGERVLLVEDVVTTGGSLDELEELVERAGGTTVGRGALISRGQADEGLEALLRLPLASWEPQQCPLCREGVGMEAPGSRHA